ncbi:tetratricopeptide repeat protein (plasmid) [Deinococcus sp. KNUC1210]|uniref:ATP-binding protein n=1 Tax=Deinococcus sp. KNUC1210 TaxID=2917691 RepID=UPI001EF1428F|nr:tetratricopeptide repeat protein [Deinococcus sp. KNUC1210]ULH17026.1 tetratricopeptide repeat protein [Deinococcus sp. KNUC1210]
MTSRERLTLDEAWTLHLRGLMLPPDGAAPQQIRQSEAVQLFLMRAMRQQLDLQIGPEDLQVIWRICAAVGGSPLGVELAAAWVRLMPLAQIGQELTRSLDLLEDSSPVRARHHSVRAVFDQSWAQLPPREQSALARLSVFGAGWTGQDAQAVAQADRSVLARLVDHSFVEITSQGRYRLHPLMQQFAAERLHTQPELEEDTTALRRATMLEFVAAAGQALRLYEAEGTWVERVFQEFESIRRSLSEWLRRGEVDAAATCLNTLRPFWMRGLALPEIRHWYGLVLSRQHPSSPALHTDTLLLAGEADMYLGHLDSAITLMTASLASARTAGRPVPLTYLLIGQAAWRRGDLTLARHHYTQAHQTFVELANWPGVAASLNNLALLLKESGDLKGAKTALEDALEAKRRSGGDEDTVLINLGTVLRDLGYHGAARERLVQGLHGVMQRGYRQFIPEALSELGRLALAAGHPVLAVRLLSAATALGRELTVVRPAHEQAESDRAAQQSEALLGQDAFADAWQAGQELPLEDIVQQLRDWSDVPLPNAGTSQSG